MNKRDWTGISRFIHQLASYSLRLRHSIGRRILRKKALRSKDEHYRLAAASQLKDESLLRQMALEAGKASIRRQAAALIQNPTCLSAIVLNTWDIELGRKVVARIHNDLMLRRVAASARQDAVRLAAAKQLGHPKLMKKIALSTADVSLRWEAARHLNDPDLMADVALFKPGHAHLDLFREQARAALSDYLNELEQQRNINGLLSFMLIQDYLPFKLQAFLRLPAEAIQFSVLQHLSRREFNYIAPPVIARVLEKVEAGGWMLKHAIRSVRCAHCRGKGILAFKTVSAAQFRYESEAMNCPDCSGIGEVVWHVVVCTGHGNHTVELKLPYSPPLYTPAETDPPKPSSTG